MTTAPVRVLYSYWGSSCSWRVRIGLALKQLSYEYRAVDLLKGEDTLPRYAALNPAGVPTLVDFDGVVVTQSLAILEYLEERHPRAPSLLPPCTDTVARAHARAVANLIAGAQPLSTLGTRQLVESRFGRDAAKRWATDVSRESCVSVEQLLKSTAGRYAVGDAFGLADCFVVPHAYSCRRFKVDIAEFPTLQRVVATANSHEAALSTHPDRMPDATPKRQQSQSPTA